MIVRPPELAARLRWGLTLVGVLCFSVTPGEAGEKIRFSDRSSKVELPVKGVTDLKSSLLLDFLGARRSELGAPDVFSQPPPRNQNTILDKRDQERMEEKRNWIMQDAESLRGDHQRKESKDADNEDESARDRKPLSLMERVIEERDRRASSTTNHVSQSGFRPEPRTIDYGSKPGLGSTNRTEFAREARRGTEQNSDSKREAAAARLPANPRSGGGELPKANGGATAELSLLERSERMRLQEERASDLRRLLDSPGALSSAPKRGADLLNTPDVTRQEINPTLGRSLNEISSRIDLKRGFDLPGTSPSSSRPNILNELNPGGFGAPGNGPASLLPSEPLRMERRPAVLEIPKRRI